MSPRKAFRGGYPVDVLSVEAMRVQMIETVRRLAAPADEQIIGLDSLPIEELAVEVHDLLSVHVPNLISLGGITPLEIASLRLLDAAGMSMLSPALCTDEALQMAPEWAALRRLADRVAEDLDT
jgi:hypothetical protein